MMLLVGKIWTEKAIEVFMQNAILAMEVTIAPICSNRY